MLFHPYIVLIYIGNMVPITTPTSWPFVVISLVHDASRDVSILTYQLTNPSLGSDNLSCNYLLIQ